MSKFSGRTAYNVTANPQEIKSRRKNRRLEKKHKIIKKVQRYINWFVRRAYGSERAKIAENYGREFVKDLEK